MRKTGFCGHTCRYMRVPLYARVKTGFWRSPKNLALLTHFSSITHSSGISPFHPWNLICSSSLPSIGSVKPVASNDRSIPTSSFHASPAHLVVRILSFLVLLATPENLGSGARGCRYNMRVPLYARVKSGF